MNLVFTDLQYRQIKLGLGVTVRGRDSNMFDTIDSLVTPTVHSF